MADAPTVGFEFPVNTFTGNDQDQVAIARDATGNSVIVWESEGQDGSQSGIFAQRFDSTGNRQGSEFRVNTFTNGNQSDPVVAMDATGNFVIAWVDLGRPFLSDGGTGTTSNEIGLYARRYTSAGSPLGEEFLADRNQTLFGIGADPGFYPVENPAIAMDADGDFVLVWNQGSSVSINPDVYARRFNRDGVAQGTASQVNTYISNSQREPDVAMDANGNFIITWVSNDQEPGGGSTGIFARLYTSSGVPRSSSEFQVNTKTANAQLKPVVGMDATGNFVIAWEDFDFGIRAQRFNSTGTPLGSEFGVQAVDHNFETDPDIALAPNGEFVITWDIFGGPVYGRAFTTDGLAKSEEFQVTSSITGEQGSPAIAIDSSGNYTIAWVDTVKDGSGNGIFAQRLLRTDVIIVNPTPVGTPGNDTLTGTDRTETIDGGEGRDIILGLTGEDTLLGGGGNDRLNGGDGNDLLNGGGGRDNLLGGAGNDSLEGENGNDKLIGGAGNDILDGGKGPDLLIGGKGRDRFVLTRRQGRDTIRDFQNGQDKFALAKGLRFDDLTLTQVGGDIFIRAGSDPLALVQSTSLSQLSAADFVKA